MMKKILALSILLGLVALAVILPDKVREAKRIYERRMVATVEAVKEGLHSAAAGTLTGAGIYAPSVEPTGEGTLLSVTGIVGRPGADGGERFEPFTAHLRSSCGHALDSGCLRVDTLLIGQSRLIEGGEVVDDVAGLPPSADGDGAAPTSGGETLPPAPPSRAETNQGSESASPRPAGVAAAGGAISEPGAENPTVVESGQGRETSPRSGGVDPAPSAPPTGPGGQSAGGSDGRVAEIQRALKQLGYDPGPADNVVGPKTLSAILAYQRRLGLETDGKPSLELLQHIRSTRRQNTTDRE